ncbi:MAG: ABC transporter permease [Chloroflexi bacterium]|nr:MAG: ABC transporter permease [Chloroflexota bacterium]
MLAYIIRRVLWSIPVLLLLAFAIFALMRAIPGGPFDFVGDKSLPKAVVENLERRYHLDWPLGWQFSSYILGDDITGAICRGLNFLPGCDVVGEAARSGNAKGLIRGDLGMAFKLRGRTVNDLVRESFPISFQLGIIAISLSVLIGLPAGVIAALKQNTWIDYLSSFLAVVGLSIPSLVLGPLLIWIFPLTLGRLYPDLFGWIPIATWGAKPPFILGIFPRSLGFEFWAHAILPATALGLAFSASIARLTRASLLQVIREDYIRTARAKGLPERAVVIVHALKNSLIPVITVLGPLLVAVVTGTFVIEQIFGIPGMGKHFVTSIGNRDYPIITGVTMIYATLLVLANLVVDILYAWLDPRIRYH